MKSLANMLLGLTLNMIFVRRTLLTLLEILRNFLEILEVVLPILEIVMVLARVRTMDLILAKVVVLVATRIGGIEIGLDLSLELKGRDQMK